MATTIVRDVPAFGTTPNFTAGVEEMFPGFKRRPDVLLEGVLREVLAAHPTAPCGDVARLVVAEYNNRRNH